jgi:tetratricopeptide (TPR) repeat protein
MNSPPAFDLTAAHRHFSAACFNAAWDLMEKPDRTSDEDILMVALNQASIWHWLQRPDCDDMRLSVGYWQASRIQALLGRPEEALRWADVCLSYSHALEPFLLAYAHEALARACRLAGQDEEAARHLGRAYDLADLVVLEDDRALLVADLETLGEPPG